MYRMIDLYIGTTRLLKKFIFEMPGYFIAKIQELVFLTVTIIMCSHINNFIQISTLKMPGRE